MPAPQPGLFSLCFIQARPDVPRDICGQLVQQDSFLSPFSPWEQVSDPGYTPSSSPPAAGGCVNGGIMPQISYQIPEEGLGARGLFCPVAVVSGPLETAIGTCKRATASPISGEVPGSSACPRNSSEVTLQATLNWERASPPAGKGGGRPSSQPEVP